MEQKASLVSNQLLEDFINVKGEVVVLPIIDFSYLTSHHSDQRLRVCHELLKACQEWGFFFLVNHGIPDEKLQTIIKAGTEFFQLPDYDKNQYMDDFHHDMRYGKDDIVYASKKDFYIWRDSLKMHLHPNQFHLPHKPQLLREVVKEYSETIRDLTKKLMEAIADALNLNKHKMYDMMEIDEGFQIMIANHYPPCPHPEQNLGMPPHTDLGLLSFLIENGVSGLQLQKDGKWFNAVSPQDNSILVNVADFLEIFTNGRCKSVKHRASTYEKQERLSMVMTDGPSLNAVVEPAEELVVRDGRALYSPRTYADYMAKKYHNNPRHCE